MNWTWFWINILRIALPKVLSAGPKVDEIVERFEYRSTSEENQSTTLESETILEFLVIGRLVSWTEAEVLCPSYVKQKFNQHLFDWETLDYDDDDENEIVSNFNEIITRGNGHLATIDDIHLAKWLAQKLAESNYRYDGLWIGGQRKRDNDTWTWIGLQKHDNNIIPRLSKNGYPPWYESENRKINNKYCLIFDKQGHDLPLFVEEDCHLRRPFVCQRISRRSIRNRLKEGESVEVDGQRYTLYHFSNEEEKEDEIQNHKTIKKLNGGGITWKDALLECHRRGKELAVVPSTEVATALADIMLKSRPSMENAWLGGWSADGSEWTWVSSGDSLPSVKSTLTDYPPWLTDHPHIFNSAEPRSFRNYYEKQTKCLILDRHLCPLHVNAVFLDLDCEKRRPFICQTVQDDNLKDGNVKIDEEFMVSGYLMKFSKTSMTWEEGKTYCEKSGTVMANINDSKTLDEVLEQMATLSLDHTWIGGRTLQLSNGEWKWFDVNGENILNSEEQSNWWCADDENKQWPDAKPDLCLNLDREGRDLPLFYGLQCNGTKQRVLCAREKDDGFKEKEIKLDDETDCNQFGPPSPVENGFWICDPASGNDSICRLQCSHRLIPVPVFLNTCTEVRNGRQIGCLGLNEFTTTIIKRLNQLVETNPKVGFLFVLDDSISVLNAWYVEQLKLVAVMIQTIFRLSVDHPMGLITFSTEAQEAIPMNETDECHALLNLSNQVLISRGADWNDRLENGTNREMTDITNAVMQTSRVLNGSQSFQNIVLFITDGEHTEDESDGVNKKNAAVEELKRLRNIGHKILALVISQGRFQQTEKDPDYKMMEEFFPNSPSGESNLYALENYKMLNDFITTLNETRKSNSTNCEQPHWIIPEDHPLLSHLLQKK